MNENTALIIQVKDKDTGVINYCTVLRSYFSFIFKVWWVSFYLLGREAHGITSPAAPLLCHVLLVLNIDQSVS